MTICIRHQICSYFYSSGKLRSKWREESKFVQERPHTWAYRYVSFSVRMFAPLTKRTNCFILWNGFEANVIVFQTVPTSAQQPSLVYVTVSIDLSIRLHAGFKAAFENAWTILCNVILWNNPEPIKGNIITGLQIKWCL